MWAPRARHKKVKGQRSAGFTLIELVIFIVMVGVLAYVSVISFSPALNFRKAAAASKTRSDIQYSQSLAMMTRQVCGVTFSGNSYTVFENGSTSDPANDPLTNKDYTVTMNTGDYAGVTISANFGGTSVVRFDREGTPSDGNGTALPSGSTNRRVTVGGDVYVVVTPTTGRVSIE